MTRGGRNGRGDDRPIERTLRADDRRVDSGAGRRWAYVQIVRRRPRPRNEK